MATSKRSRIAANVPRHDNTPVLLSLDAAGTFFNPQSALMYLAMIRPTLPTDTPVLLTLTAQTEVFKPLEVRTLEEVLTYYHETARGLGHRCVTCERPEGVCGFAYYAQEDMTDRTWNLWWIVVGKQVQAKGLGGELLRFVEEDIRGSGGRVLFIETSSLPHYDLTRRFYLKHAYEQAAVLADYYTDGDDMVVFRKRLLLP